MRSRLAHVARAGLERRGRHRERIDRPLPVCTRIESQVEWVPAAAEVFWGAISGFGVPRNDDAMRPGFEGWLYTRRMAHLVVGASEPAHPYCLDPR